jgi:glycosyltransferase involved in cell wall biosynthesis
VYLKNVVIVVPTYNERENIGVLIGQLFGKIIPTIIEWNVSVLIVDGNSPDGTADLVSDLQADHKRLHLINENIKEGIGAAYFKGFRYAENRLRANVLIEFDGDLQHSPEILPVLLEKIDGGADLVLGSRKISGGSWPEEFEFKRQVLSRLGGFITRSVLFFPGPLFKKITDPTTGLKATRVGRHYRILDFDSFISRGFGYKVEMLYRLLKSGAVVAEIPLSFNLRNEGKSKIEKNTVKEIFKTILKLRFNNII